MVSLTLPLKPVVHSPFNKEKLIIFKTEALLMHNKLLNELIIEFSHCDNAFLWCNYHYVPFIEDCFKRQWHRAWLWVGLG